MFLEVTKSFRKISMQLLFTNTAHDTTTGAVATVTRTPICHQKENTIGVAMDQPWHWHMRILTARISHVIRRTISLLDPRYHLAPDRIIWIFVRNQIEKMWRDCECKLVS